jgi:SAM-dependent methyltransferase
MPKAHFICAEANSLSFNKDCFDIAISNSVFHYFPDYKYDNEVLLEIVRVLRPGGEGLILDINDLSKREYAENKRREDLGVEEYEKRYKDLPQMYYDKEWFEEFALKNNLEFEIFDQNIVGYDNSEWRFNFYFKKN